ncbi:MAG: ATP synthase F0 subunit B [Proteobacteria bacterium]|nr:ATP synthase F0 subunit B [Pseudomonadota bacterium]
MFRKSLDTVVIALIFVGVAMLLEKFNFWGALGLETPHFFIFSGLMFLLLVVVFQHTIFDPYGAISNERHEQTTEKRKRADERKVHAETILKSYEQSILNARMDALKQRERIAMEAESKEREIIDSAKQKSQVALDSAMSEIASKIEITRKELVSSSAPLVAQLVDEVLSGEMGKKPGSSSSKSVETRM